METCHGKSGSPTCSSEYATVWSSPPKKLAGRTKFQETRHSIYKGVRCRGNSKRWICEIREPNKGSRIWLGTFPSAEMAARAHDVAAIALKGRAACLNFADSAWLINIPSSFSSLQELKNTAAYVASMLHHKAENREAVINVFSLTTSPLSEETEMVSSDMSSDDDASDSDAFDQIAFNMDVNGEMDLGLYYSSLAEALLMEPPMWSKGGWDEEEESTELTLWSYAV